MPSPNLEVPDHSQTDHLQPPLLDSVGTRSNFRASNLLKLSADFSTLHAYTHAVYSLAKYSRPLSILKL